MKRTFITLLIILIGGTSFSSFAQKSITDSGFYLNVGGFAPNYKYLVPLAFENDILEKPENTETLYKLGANIEIGNLFKVADIGSNAIHVKVSWLDANIAKSSYEGKYLFTPVNFKYYAIQGSAFKLGPNFTYALNDKMGIDVFYQIAPVFSFWYDDTDYGPAFEDSEMSYDDNLREKYALGVLHTTGLAFRYDFLSAGINWNFGSAKDFDADDNATTFNTDVDYYRYRMGSFRFYIGFKF